MALAEATPEQSRALWLEERRSGIGGSDAAAILGISRWRTPLDVWLDKRGEGPPDVDTEPMRWGRDLEDVIANRYAQDTGRRLEKPAGIMRHPVLPFVIGTPDRLVVDEPLGLEIKTSRSADEWGAQNTDLLPSEYLVQCAHYMAVTGRASWDVAVLIAGSDYRTYTVARDPEFEEAVLSRLAEWWDRHVVSGEQPPLDGSEGARRWLSRKFPHEAAAMMPAPPIATELAGRLHEARVALEAWEAVKGECENKLKAMIGEAEGLDGRTWKATWKTVRGRTSVNYQAAASGALDRLEALGYFKDGQLTRDQFLAGFTQEAPGVRRFLFSFKGGPS